MLKDLPVVGITMGDPAGIGPEIIAKALSRKKIYELCRPVVIGDAQTMRRAVKIIGSENTVKAIADINEASYEYGAIDVFDLKNVKIDEFEFGKVSAMAGKAAYEAIAKVIELALARKIDATVTAPINKEALNLAGFHYSGHTDIYAELTGTKDYTMMLVHDEFRVVHVSTHVSLRQACDLVKKDRVLKVIGLADRACKELGIKNPKIGVAGLNPHSSEGGLFGFEEEKEIIPAIKDARNSGMTVDGPVPPDTLFAKANGGLYDIVVAMYHDQGHIPLKVVGFKWNRQKNEWDTVNGVNITLGLPIIRSSVDHGTAFEIAGKGIASDDSMISAIEYGVMLARGKGKAN